MLQDVLDLITNIVTLCEDLPSSVPIASTSDKIYHVMTGEEEEDTWHTFNKRFDALFGHDCRDDQGRLQHIRRGQCGMKLVGRYLQQIDLTTGDIPFDLMALKLRRLYDEIVHLQLVFFIKL